MKKFLFAAALIVGVVVSQIVVPSQAQAADYYLGEWEGGWKAYWIVESCELESANEDYSHFVNSCQVKAVSPQGTVKYIDYVMLIEISSNGHSRISFKDSLGGQGTFYSDNVGVYQIEGKLAMGLIALLIQSMDSR